MKAGFFTFITNYRVPLIALVIVFAAIVPEVVFAADFGCSINPACHLAEFFYNTMFLFANITGNILDAVTKLFVFEMSDTLETPNLFTFGEGEVPVYRQVWFVVRDLANLSFIFILIYAALATIFQVPNVNVRRIVPQLILVAILMNFSLFFVQIATDFSNYLSYQFFTAVEIQVNGDTVQIGQNEQQGLSSLIMDVTRLPALATAQEATGAGGFSMAFFGGIFIFIASLVMLAGAMLLFIRFFMILIYMIASPVAFAASIVQGGKDKITKGWWMKGLIAQLTFAPAYFGLLYLSLYFLSSLTGSGALNPNNTDQDPLAYFVTNALIFTISGAFLIGSLIAAKRIGAVGAGTALNFVKRTGFTGILGGAGFVGRQSFGRVANRYVNSNQDQLNQRIAEGGVSGKIARMQLKSGKYFQGATYDARLGLDRIPGLKMTEMSYGNRKDLEKSYVDRREEKRSKKLREAVEVASSLSDEQRDRYANKLKTKKEGILGLMQFATHTQSEDGSLVYRDRYRKNIEEYKDGVKKFGDGIEEKLLEGNPGLSRRKIAAVVNRYKNHLIREDYSTIYEDDEVVKVQEQKIAEEKYRRDQLLSANKKRIADIKRQISDQTLYANTKRQELSRLEQQLEQAIAQNNDNEARIIESQIETVRAKIDNTDREMTELKSIIPVIKEDNRAIERRSQIEINKHRNEGSEERSKQRTINGGYINYRIGDALFGKNFEITVKALDKAKKRKENFEIWTDVVARGQQKSGDIETVADPFDLNSPPKGGGE